MAGVRITIYGHDIDLVTSGGIGRPGAQGEIICIAEAPQVTSAQFKIGDYLPSDQSCSVRLIASDRLRQLFGSRAKLSTMPRLVVPLMPQHTRLYLSRTFAGSLPSTVWVGKECMRVTSASVQTDTTPYSPTFGLHYIDVERAYRGTWASRIDLTAGQPLVCPSYPLDIVGCECTVSVVRERHEPQLGGGTIDSLGRSVRPALHGSILSVTDAGDVIELEIVSGIEKMLNTRWPEIPALLPYSKRLEDAIASQAASAGFQFFDMHPPFTGRVGWGTTTTSTSTSTPVRYLSGRLRSIGGSPQEILRETILSTGSYAVRTAGGLRETSPARINAYGGQAYAGPHPLMADDPDRWVGVIVRGPDGYTGSGRPSGDGREATPTEYIPLGLERIVDRPSLGDLPPVDIDDASTMRDYTLGTYGYRVTRSSAASTIGRDTYQGAGYYYGDTVRDAPFRSRHGRLDAAPLDTDQKRIPGVIKPAFAVRAHHFQIGFSSPTPLPALTTAVQYVSAQLPRGAGLGAEVAVLSAGARVSPRAVDMDVVAPMLASIFTDAGVTTAIACAEGRVRYRRQDGVIFSAAIWLPEVWLGRTIRETVFQDFFILAAIAWSPGPGGSLRPIHLAAQPDPLIDIGESHLRDRDHTVIFDAVPQLSRVTVTGLRASVNAELGEHDPSEDEGAVPDGYEMPKGRAWAPETIDVVSSEVSDAGIAGRSLQLKATPYHNRDRTYWRQGGPFPIRAIHDCIERNWAGAVGAFGAAYPSVVLRIDGDLNVWPGDTVTITARNMPTRQGLGADKMRAMLLERGDDLDTGTAECTFLLTGWFDDPAEWSPLELGPLVWLDPSDMDTLFVDSAGTTPVQADGDPVGLWKNKGTAGAAGDAVQTVSASRPLWTNAGGSEGIVGFTSTVFLGTTVVIASPFTIAASYDLSVVPAGRQLLSDMDNSAALGGWSVWNAASSMSLNVSPSRAATANGASSSICVASMTSGGDCVVYTDKNMTGGAVLNVGAGWTSSSPMKVGSRLRAFQGTLRKVFVFDRVLSEDERTKLIEWMEAQ